MHKSRKIMLTAIFAVGGLYVALLAKSTASGFRSGSALTPVPDIVSSLSP